MVPNVSEKDASAKEKVTIKSVVPLSQIATLPKGTNDLDLSGNNLFSLPQNFTFLTNLVKLDLSCNSLKELPAAFGHLKNLKYLDLYSNKLENLPLSFGQLKNLKWLDLKNNPLTHQLQEAAGACITPLDCGLCAKKVVALMQDLSNQNKSALKNNEEDEEITLLEWNWKGMEILKNETVEIKKELDTKPKVRLALTTGEDFNDLILDYLMEKVGGKEEVIEVSMEDTEDENFDEDEANFRYNRTNRNYFIEEEQSNYSEKHLLEYSMDEECIKATIEKEDKPKNMCWSLLMLFFAMIIFPMLLAIKVVKDKCLRN